MSLIKIADSCASSSTNRITPSPECRASQSLYETIAVSLFARLPPRALLVASPLARDSRSATFPSRIFEQKRDCSQSSIKGAWPGHYHLLLSKYYTLERFSMSVESNVVIALFLLYCALWLVNKTCATFSTNGKLTKTSHDMAARVFPRLVPVTCISFEFWLVLCVVYVFLLVGVITLVLVFDTQLQTALTTDKKRQIKCCCCWQTCVFFYDITDNIWLVFRINLVIRN